MPVYNNKDEEASFTDYKDGDISNKLTFISMLLLIIVFLMAYKCFYIYR